jgi:5-methylcytosine-specific restriction endonuclease McrA
MPLPRPCLDCGRLIPSGTRCGRCRKTQDAKRGTTKQRGYHDGWDRLSKRVIARDGGVCQLQLSCCTQIATTTDHIVPRSKGGSSEESNLQAACRPCNSAKRDR